MPSGFVLSQNFPNPFNPTTRIPYSLSDKERVTLKVYDTAGREISTLVDRVEPAGEYAAEFDASRLASGVYLYRLQIGNRVVDTKKAVLLR